jgi:hypothetical protein
MHQIKKNNSLSDVAQLVKAAFRVIDSFEFNILIYKFIYNLNIF